MKKLNKVLILGVAGACLLSSGMLLSGCKKVPTPITVTTEDGVVLSRYKEETSWTVSNFSQTAETIIIPDEFNEMPVVNIANGAKISAYVRTVTIGKNITTLSPELFSESVNLQHLDYNAINAKVNKDPNKVITPIFSNKTGSEQEGFVLNIGVEVEQIPENFMVATDSLTNVYNSGVLRPHYQPPKLEGINFAEDGKLKTIGAFAFIGCNTIDQTLELPASLENIEEYAFAFSGVSGILNLAGNINHVNSYAFWNSKITQINFNTEVTEVSNNAFETDTLKIVTVNSCFETEGSNFFGDNAVSIVVTNANMAKLDTVYSMAPNGNADFFITTDISQSEINADILENATYIDTVTLGEAQFYHYK